MICTWILILFFCLALCFTWLFCFCFFFFSSRRRHTRCALVTGVQTCALPILQPPPQRFDGVGLAMGQKEAARYRPTRLDPRADVVLIGKIGRASCRERVCQYV